LLAYDFEQLLHVRFEGRPLLADFGAPFILLEYRLVPELKQHSAVFAVSLGHVRPEVFGQRKIRVVSIFHLPAFRNRIIAIRPADDVPIDDDKHPVLQGRTYILIEPSEDLLVRLRLPDTRVDADANNVRLPILCQIVVIGSGPSLPTHHGIANGYSAET